MHECANCGSGQLLFFPSGIYAPFFMHRVFQIHPGSLEEGVRAAIQKHPTSVRSTLTRAALWVMDCLPVFQRILDFRGEHRTSIAACQFCGFIGLGTEIPEDWLARLYLDYRGDTYNHDRILFEPEYRVLAPQIGRHTMEMEARDQNCSELLGKHAKLETVAAVLDWGGGEGRFVPSILRDRQITVFDIAGIPAAAPPYRFVQHLDEGERFEYIQLCHVLEHLQRPRQTLQRVLRHLAPSGYVYLEVPMDQSTEILQALLSGRSDYHHYIHEHINLYSEKSIISLGHSLRLKPLHIHTSRLDLGYTIATVISGLFQGPTEIDPEAHMKF